VTAALDDYTARWSAMRREACEATRVREEVSEDMLDRRMACLGRSRSAVATLVELLRGDAIAADVSPLDLVYRLPSLSACEDLARLDAEPSRPADPAERRGIELAEAEVEHAEVLGNAGLRTQALERIDGVIAQAQARGWSALTAKALVSRAQISGDLGDDGAIGDWRRASVAAIAVGPEAGFSAAMTGAKMFARRGEADEAAFALDLAEAHAAQLGGEPRPGEVVTMRAFLARERGDRVEAESSLREAIAALEGDPDRPDELALAWGNLGGILASAARVDEALHATERAIELSAAQFGDRHLFTLRWRTNRAGIALMGYRYAAAARESEEVVVALRQLDSELDVAAAVIVLGRARMAQDRVDEGCALLQEGLAIRERAVPTGTAPIRNARYHVALCAATRERFDAAEDTLRRALEDVTPGEGAVVADLEALLAFVLTRTDRAAEALSLTRRWLDADLAPGTAHDVLRSHALALREQGDRDGAVAALQRAVALQQPGVHDARLVGTTRLELADLLLESGDHGAARAQVEAAVAFMEAVDDRDNATWNDLHAWLDRYRG
jgi:tetratricopeptide (TPR) repeat protein